MDSSAICPKCRRDESAERRDDERSQRELYREAYLSRRAVDIELAQAKDPLKIKAFCDHLTVLRQVWERGRVSQEDSLQQRHVVRGCMICGQDTTLIVFLTRETMPQDDHFFADETWAEDRFFGFEFTESGSYYLEGLPPLAAPATTAQVIWRYAPEHYFDTLRLPVFAMPLVLVCEHCAIVVPPTYVRTKI